MISMRRCRPSYWRNSSESQACRTQSPPTTQPHPTVSESTRENRAESSSSFSAFLRFSSVSSVLNLLTRIFCPAFLAPAFEPTVANGEEERRVVSRVVPANAGIGQMSERGFGGKRAAWLHKHVRAECESLREIYGCGVARRNITGGEHRAANDRNVRRIFIPTGEVPLPDRGPDARAINSAGWRKDGEERQHVHGPFEIAAQDAGQMVAGQDPAPAPAAKRKLSAVGFAKTGTTASDNAQFPRVLFQRLRNPILRHGSGGRRGRILRSNGSG